MLIICAGRARSRSPRRWVSAFAWRRCRRRCSMRRRCMCSISSRCGLPATHALSPALAPVLALAESIGASGREVLAALIKGIEIQGWIRRASGHVESRDLKFHPPGMVGPIGAAVAAAHLLRLRCRAARQRDRHRLLALRQPHQQYRHHDQVDPLRLCGVARPGGGAARRDAASPATTPPSTGPHGYVEAFLPPHFDREMLLSFGPPFRLVDPGYTLKIFPCKFTTHYGITAALAARPSIPSPDAIRAVRVLAPVVPTGDRPHPEDRARRQVQRAIYARRGAARRRGDLVDLHRRAPASARHAGAARQDHRHHDAGHHHRIQCRPLCRARGRARRRHDCARALRAAARLLGRGADLRGRASRRRCGIASPARCRRQAIDECIALGEPLRASRRGPACGGSCRSPARRERNRC